MCAPGRIRTCDTGFRRAVLYPLSYWGRGAQSQAPDVEQGSGSGVREWSAGHGRRRSRSVRTRTPGFVPPGRGRLCPSFRPCGLTCKGAVSGA
ncbi:hypothetical protein SCOCK_90033 [Actinacidiphila cocklensis]|uniref:Uncharacterized protein n=1 Tax=Actinacidiphila cocklensis TaxID=887465 RepID=A0A9W4E017_9ACTN|nr:hypothetical protein SCOCK_90033 [Actinacidiphila cocklensis]